MHKNKKTCKIATNALILRKILILVLYFVLVFVFPLETCPLMGQVIQKKKLIAADYHLWGELNLEKVSPDENWASFKMEYKDGSDTLFIFNPSSNKKYSIPRAGEGSFTMKNFFICQIGNSLQILNLKTGKREEIDNVQKHAYCQQTDHLIVLTGTGTSGKILKIQSLKNSDKVEINDVSDFQISDQAGRLAYCISENTKEAVFHLSLKKIHSSKWVVRSSKDHFKGLTWHKSGQALSFYSESADKKINGLFYYLPTEDKLSQFSSASHPGFPKNAYIVYENSNQILISDDLQKLFFSVRENEKMPLAALESGVEIWNANDKITYLQLKSFGDPDLLPKVVMWSPKSDSIRAVATAEFPKVMLTGDFKNAIVSNPKQYEPQFDYYAPRDFYILNLQTFEKTLLLENHPLEYENLLASPGGKYFAYFKEKNWWIYNFELRTHTNITGRLGVGFSAKEYDLNPESVCGSPGWSLNDNEILLYDQYDIWAVAPNGKSSRRLTHGRESKIKFRIAAMPNSIGVKLKYDGLIVRNIDIQKQQFLRAEGEDGKTGYFKWTEETGEKPIVYEQSLINQLNYGIDKKKLFFREQKYDVSPRLLYKSQDADPSCFYRSNPQQEKYFWGRSILIEYKNSAGKCLKGALYYPADYDPKIKYPMIVTIYDLQSKQLHKYVNPALNDLSGNNTTLFTSENYFVFKPDLSLEVGSPGHSAVDCVVSATKKVIGMGLVDPAKIGLMGHSFGGYETSFIVTQTDLFAAVISSGAITDLNSFYHNINSLTGRPDMWRFGNEQWAMGKTPYEAPESYFSNSPLSYVKNIRTPILIWSGKNDTQVDPHQSFEYYLALRRLGKKSIMLLYPEEGHLLLREPNQIDITKRTLQWFDFFLKGKQSEDWILKGIK
ncbi:alpha/beta hydrolase family protein [Flavobacterium panici]|uniref:Peptidase S9 prolyl oligopeptidase catalytic domain-containing protein n=1 Tax=Flavobacterium panici TaxID=2654843 RepID=A0A9N8J1E0_9FLAO|nr:prolyl oligopeptidase family serine peptidase [Flavobacterium panici]CAC9974408.1 hypothetical protein FLAPXU55_02105 [Flavobacterium panici]